MITSIERSVIDGTGHDDRRGWHLDLRALPGDGERRAVARQGAGRRVRLRCRGVQAAEAGVGLERECADRAGTALAARATTELVVVSAAGWLLPLLPQAVSSGTATRATPVGSVMAQFLICMQQASATAW